MPKVIVITSGKGGVGKTATSAAFSTGLERAAEYSRGGIALGARKGPPAQSAIDVDMTIGPDLCTGADLGHDHEITALGVDLPARTHWLVDYQGSRQGLAALRLTAGGDRPRRCA